MRSSRSNFELASTIVGAIVLLILTELFMPFIAFWLAFAGGWVCSLVVGKPLCEALNMLFGTSRFSVEMIPWIAAALGWIGGFFKKIVKITKE